MAARTDGIAVRKSEKGVSGREETVNWKLNHPSGPKDLQRWRRIGDGRSSKEQIREYAAGMEKSESVEGENACAGPSEVAPPVPLAAFAVRESGPSSTVTLMAEDDQESNEKRSVDFRGELPRAVRSREGVKSSDEGGNLSGQEEDDDSSDERAVTEAHSFKIFQPDDEERRESASILSLDFHRGEGEKSSSTLLMIFSSRDSSMPIMRTIDSWTIRVEGEKHLRAHVRDAGGSWIKLLNPSKGYEKSAQEALLILSFLEMAMTVKKVKGQTFASLVMSKTGATRLEITNVLRRYFDSVVEKYIHLLGAPPYLRDAPLIKNMAASLRREADELRNDPASNVGSPTGGGALGKQNKADAHQFAGHKRKRIVESDSGEGSDSDDHVPLSQRNFHIEESLEVREEAVSLVGRGVDLEEAGRVEKLEVRDERRQKKKTKKSKGLEKAVWSRDKDVGNPDTADDILHSPASSRDEGPSGWNDQDLVDTSEQEFQEEDVLPRQEREFEDMDTFYGNEEDVQDEAGDDDDDGDELGYSALCSLCDDGGHLLFCDGPCIRSFHASKLAATLSEANCQSLGYTEQQVREMGSWYCRSCVSCRHQCFICGELGKSEGKDKEVFACDVALCGRFYHPKCLGLWRHYAIGKGITDVQAFVKVVNEGVEGFCCPAHNCTKCGEGEGGTDDESRKLAKCRRCPKVYHRDCLPKEISFERRHQEQIRAWEIGNALIIYCLDHDIVKRLGTPARNHLKWPKTGHGDSSSGIIQRSRLPSSLAKPKKGVSDVGRLKLDTEDKWPFRRRGGEVLEAALNRKEVTGQVVEEQPFVEEVNISREGQEERILKIMSQASELVTLDDVRKDLEQLSCYQETTRTNSRPYGELKSTLTAASKALEKFKNSGRIDDFKQLCPKDPFLQMLHMEASLKIRLAPFLHGTRYTSFGRHFTCVDKLKEIVERIHPYIDHGDMVVDFCCGSNDFSVLLNDKLVTEGKACRFMNFDIHPPKNDFCFAKGDWLLNRGEGFCEGDRLVMGLNPPFAHATTFVKHALQFRPKLLILIVPRETMSFSKDFERFGYDLVWEDEKFLSGHAFYLPGSVGTDGTENLTQWNRDAPLLNLWSRKDMTNKHKDVALRCGRPVGL